MLAATKPIIMLAAASMLAPVFAFSYDTTTYVEEQKSIGELQDASKHIDNTRIEILNKYASGEYSKEDALYQMNLLYEIAHAHLIHVESNIQFLNISHNYKNTQLIITNIEYDMEFLQQA